MTGHARGFVKDRPQPVATVAAGIVRRPILGKKHAASRRGGSRLNLFTVRNVVDIRLTFSVREEQSEHRHGGLDPSCGRADKVVLIGKGWSDRWRRLLHKREFGWFRYGQNGCFCLSRRTNRNWR